jgi:tRNA(Leu) C34 or U34 (ribose-2'-O)-methylase TrmL
MDKMIVGKNAPIYGRVPAIVLANPKFPHNVGTCQRACSCFGVSQLWWTGNRVSLDIEKGERLPREERMRGYKDVQLINYDKPFDQFPKGTVPVAIEVRQNSEHLTTFEHPENAVYVFGPEDGSIPSVFLGFCHRFVIVPTKHCLNLAATVNIVLYDRMMKRGESFHIGNEEQRVWAEPDVNDCFLKG